jgi:hypothetical protein
MHVAREPNLPSWWWSCHYHRRPSSGSIPSRLIHLSTCLAPARETDLMWWCGRASLPTKHCKKTRNKIMLCRVILLLYLHCRPLAVSPQYVASLQIEIHSKSILAFSARSVSTQIFLNKYKITRCLWVWVSRGTTPVPPKSIFWQWCNSSEKAATVKL